VSGSFLGEASYVKTLDGLGCPGDRCPRGLRRRGEGQCAPRYGGVEGRL